MRPVVIGLARNSAAGSSISQARPLPAESSTWVNLARVADMPPEKLAGAVDRINLHALPTGIRPLADADARAAANLMSILRGRRVLMLGGRVAGGFLRAAGLEGSCPEVQGWTGGPTLPFVWAKIPHTSGLCRWYNDPANVDQARQVVAGMDRPPILVEGPDGAGKSHLAAALAKALNRPLMPTRGPLASYDENLKEFRRRLAPGIVADRSIGLVSELVYGPVLRGETMGDEDRYWRAAEAAALSAVLVYCRPPHDVIQRHCTEARKGEDPAHIEKVLKTIDTLVIRYDRVVARLEGMGWKVYRYDWTDHTYNTNPEKDLINELRDT